VRLGQLVGAPVLLCALLASAGANAVLRARRASPRRAALVAMGADLREAGKVADDPSSRRSYYEPLVDWLKSRPGPPARVEIPQMRSQWESYYVAGRSRARAAGSARPTSSSPAVLRGRS
jgi:hypothetical protein